jgi:hypothetical protein
MRSLLIKKKIYIEKEGSGQLHVTWRRQYQQLNNAIQLNTLMMSFVSKLNDGLMHLVTQPKNWNDPIENRPSYKVVDDVNDMLLVLSQCRAIISLNYGWRMDMMIGNLVLPFPWSTNTNYSKCSIVFNPVIKCETPPTKHCITASELYLPTDCIMAITEIAVQSPSFTDISAYYAWFATCRQLQHYFISKNDCLVLLLGEKMNTVAINGKNKLHVQYYNQYKNLLDAFYIEQLTCYIVEKMRRVFDKIVEMTNQSKFGVVVRQQPLCAVGDLIRQVSEYHIWLLTQCRARIKVRYGWQLELIQNDQLSFPWHHYKVGINTQIVVVDSL